MGINDVSDDKVAEILAQVKARGISKKTILSDEEFREIVNAVL
jgi:hypothetical protein